MPSHPPDLAIGEEWAYRPKTRARVTPVRVVRIGTKKPLRVFVHFLDDSFEGREEWVPPTRLKVLWPEASDWQEREDRWQAVFDSSREIHGTPEYWAAGMVSEAWGATFDTSIEAGAASDTEVLCISDLHAVATQLGIDPDELSSEPLSFFDDDGSFVAPWSVALRVLKLVAPLVAEAVLEEVAKKEEKCDQRAMYGEDFELSRGDIRYIPPERCVEYDEVWRLADRVAQEWCGQPAIERHDELLALRDEVIRIGQIAERAIRALEEAGQRASADGLKRDLGVPIETLRASEDNYRQRARSSGS